MEFSQLRLLLTLTAIVMSVMKVSGSGSGSEGEVARAEGRSKRYVLFPQFTVLQVTVAIAIPMEVPQRKVAINLGVQSNFNLPYTPKEFYKPPYWDTRSLKKGRQHHHQGNETSRHTRSLTAVGTCRDASATIEQNSLPFDDIPVESFYSYIKNYLQIEGFGEDCLEKAICEMSKHPLEHQHDNLMSELLHFIFSPSQHSEALHGSNGSAHLHAAEQHGLNAADCNQIYGCPRSPLEHLTVLEEEEEEEEEIISRRDEIKHPK